MENKRIQNQSISDEKDIHQLLVQTYGEETVPKDLNIRLKNKLDYKEKSMEKGVSLWWIPVAISTCLTVSILVFSVIGYLLINANIEKMIMPNLIHFVSNVVLFVLCGLSLVQMSLSWIFTGFSLWKLNLRKKSKIFN